MILKMRGKNSLLQDNCFHFINGDFVTMSTNVIVGICGAFEL